MKLGVIADCLKLPLAEAVEKAAALKLDGVQIYATGGAFSPGVLTDREKAFLSGLACAYGAYRKRAVRRHGRARI